mgnify:CR=1 FL=1|tara:strand:- start:16855 stop:17901 length:1047 start_codon:yes stop_codon:yes gene_type:complete
MRALLLPCLILFAATPAHAELQDVRARVSGQEGRVWLAFDTQPTALEIIPGETGVDLVIGGVSVASQQLSPANRELVTALAAEPGAGGARIHLEGAQAWQSVSAELRSGGVLVTVSLSSPAAASPSHMASSYPPLDPHWTPTPVPATQDLAVHAAASEAQHAEAPHGEAPHLEVPDTGPAPDVPDIAHGEVQPTAAAPHSPTSIAPQPHADAPAHSPAPAEQASTAARASSLPGQAASMAAAALPAGTRRCEAAAADFEANPWNDASLMIHAACLSEAGDITTAAILYQQMLAFEPDNVEAALGLADIRLQQGDPEAARDLYNLAASNATSDAQAARARNQARALQQH